MFILICKRRNLQDEIVFIPIMKADEDGEPDDSIGTWETLAEVQEFCQEHILASTSENIIIDDENGEIHYF